ncbi:MAG: S8 family serine peptidase [Candidatus Eisenbacteria bacterium]
MRESIAIPADSPAALSVGAYEYDANAAATRAPVLQLRRRQRQADEAEDPGRQRGRQRRTQLRGDERACPHVAGAVALLLSASIEGGMYDARLTPRAVRRLLENEALPLVAGTRLPDAEGWGRARLVIDRPSARTVASITVERASDAGLRLVLQTPGRSATTTLRLFDLAGRHLATLAPFEISARTQRFELGDGWRAPRGRYWVRDPASGARASFYWPGRP